MYFHTGDFQATLVFQDNECQKDFVYVSDMDANHYLYHENPYLHVTSDGVILNLDQRFKTVGLYNANDELLEQIEFNFMSQCETNTPSIIELKSPQILKTSPILLVLLIVFIVSLIYIRKETKHES